MTRTIEQELSALFHDAVSHLEIQPLPVRRTRAATLSRTVAVGLAAAVVAGLVLVSLRLAGDGSARTVPAGPGESPAAQELLAAMTRTWNQPLRIEATTTMDDRPSAPGAPDPAPQTSTTVTELDETRHIAVMHSDNGQTALAVDGHLYVAVKPDEMLPGQLPAGVRWIELPSNAMPPTVALLGLGTGGVSTPEAVRAALAAGRATVTADGPDQFVLHLPITTQPGHDDAHRSRGVVETVHLSPAGLVDRISLDNVFDPDANLSMSGTAHIEPLGRPVQAEAPDPETVIDADELQNLTTPQSDSGSGAYSSECTVTMDPARSDQAPAGGEVIPQQCAMSSSGTTVGTRVLPKHR